MQVETVPQEKNVQMHFKQKLIFCHNTDTTRNSNAFGFWMSERRSNAGWFSFQGPFENGTISLVFEWYQKLFDKFRAGCFIQTVGTTGT